MDWISSISSSISGSSSSLKSQSVKYFLKRSKVEESTKRPYVHGQSVQSASAISAISVSPNLKRQRIRSVFTTLGGLSLANVGVQRGRASDSPLQKHQLAASVATLGSPHFGQVCAGVWRVPRHRVSFSGDVLHRSRFVVEQKHEVITGNACTSIIQDAPEPVAVERVTSHSWHIVR